MPRVETRVVCSKCGGSPDSAALLLNEEMADTDEVLCGSCEGRLVVVTEEEIERRIVRTVGEIRQAILSVKSRKGEMWN